MFNFEWKVREIGLLNWKGTRAVGCDCIWMRTVRSPERDTIRALFSGDKRQNFDGKRACVPCGIDGGMRTIGREPPNDSQFRSPQSNELYPAGLALMNDH